MILTLQGDEIPLLQGSGMESKVLVKISECDDYSGRVSGIFIFGDKSHEFSDADLEEIVAKLLPKLSENK